MISTSTSLQTKKKYKNSNAMEISKLLMVQIQILTFKICGRFKGLCGRVYVIGWMLSKL